MPDDSSTRSSKESAKPGMRQATSHSAAPANKHRSRPAMVEQARAGPGQRKRREQDRVGEIDRDQIGDRAVQAEQHDRAARNRCAKPHHATAVIAVFCAQANSSSNPRIAST